MENIIVTENVTKHYGKVKAVDGISIKVRKGEIYGFLGLNGAGKTTLIRMLLGMIRPTSGYATIQGQIVSAGNYQLWSEVGYLVETPYSYPDLTVRENLELLSDLRRISDISCIETIIGKLNLNQYADRKAKHLSLGNAQRLGLAKALMHNPSILILDEPSNGLDPAGIVEIRELLHDLSINHGVTVFVSSHILAEIAKIASRVAIIHQGKLLQELNTEQLNASRKRRLVLEARDLRSLQQQLIEMGYSFESAEKSVFVTDAHAVNNPDAICKALVQNGSIPTKLVVEEEDLESYFLRIINNNGGNK
jgi:ABC-2 type transport system ATP-binding protein